MVICLRTYNLLIAEPEPEPDLPDCKVQIQHHYVLAHPSPLVFTAPSWLTSHQHEAMWTLSGIEKTQGDTKQENKGISYHRKNKRPFFILTGVQLLYNVWQFLLYSKVNQLYVFIYPLFFGFPSHLGHHRALSRVPCTTQSVLTPVLYTVVYICKSQSIPPPPPHSPLESVCVLYVCVSYFYFADKFTYTVLFLTHFTLRQSLGPFTSLQMAQFHSFLC